MRRSLRRLGRERATQVARASSCGAPPSGFRRVENARLQLLATVRLPGTPGLKRIRRREGGAFPTYPGALAATGSEGGRPERQPIQRTPTLLSATATRGRAACDRPSSWSQKRADVRQKEPDWAGRNHLGSRALKLGQLLSLQGAPPADWNGARAGQRSDELGARTAPIGRGRTMAELTNLESKLGEVVGLAMAAQVGGQQSCQAREGGGQRRPCRHAREDARAGRGNGRALHGACVLVRGQEDRDPRRRRGRSRARRRR